MDWLYHELAEEKRKRAELEFELEMTKMALVNVVDREVIFNTLVECIQQNGGRRSRSCEKGRGYKPCITLMIRALKNPCASHGSLVKLRLRDTVKHLSCGTRMRSYDGGFGYSSYRLH